MALIKPDPADDCTQSTETDFPKVKNEASKIDDSTLGPVHEKLTCTPEGMFSIVPIKSEPDDSSSEDWDDCEDVMKKELDEAESDNELENPLFVSVKEEVDDENLLDGDTFELSGSAQSPIPDTSRLPRDASCVLVASHSECLRCCHPCNPVETQNVNPEEYLNKNRTQCVCKSTLKLRSSTECEIPLGIASTCEVEERIYKIVREDGKVEDRAEAQGTEMQNEKSIDENNGESLGEDGVPGSMKNKSCPLFNTSSKQVSKCLSSKRNNKCSQCGKKFNKFSDFMTHMRVHSGEKPFQCNECGKAFNQKGNLNIHMRQHTGEKPFECNQCGKVFNHGSSLTRHIRYHTGEKHFKCNLCGQRFAENFHLTTHIRTHTGEKSFKCHQCEKAFNKNSNLTAHMRLHTGERPFKCNQCEKAFRQSGHLTVHMRYHTGEKRFKYNRRGRPFDQSYKLTHHTNE